MDLLKEMCRIEAPSGNEGAMKTFILDYINKNKSQWAANPEVIHGPEIQDCIVVKFGNPRTAVFAHMDSIGFTVRYQNQLVPIGGPDAKSGYKLKGKDSLGPILCDLEIGEKNELYYKFGRGIERGTPLVFDSHFRETDDYVQTCYLDNRLGVYNALKLAEDLTDGLLVFSCREEHGGGTVPFLVKLIYEKFGVKQCLISDITWVTEGIFHGEGVVISMRDKGIPPKTYLDKIIGIAEASGIDFQLEVEGGGSSDARELQASPYPIDWCFIGAAEDFVHSPDEKVHKHDINTMLAMYQLLMKGL